MNASEVRRGSRRDGSNNMNTEDIKYNLAKGISAIALAVWAYNIFFA